MELKNIVKNHLTEKKETDRLKRVEANEKLEKITLLTNGTPYCDTVKDYLNQEGIRYNEKTIKDNPKDIDRASSITNLSMFLSFAKCVNSFTRAGCIVGDPPVSIISFT